MLTFISSIPVVVPQLIWNAYSSTSSTLFTDLLTPFQRLSPFVLARVRLLKSAFVLPLLQNEPFVVVITRCWSGRTTAISSVMTLASTSETGLASRTFAAADGNTPWLSSKMIYSVFWIFHLPRLYFCCFYSTGNSLIIFQFWILSPFQQLSS